MDDNQDEFLLASYRRWAIDAGIPEHLVQMAEREARKGRKLYPDQRISEMFYELIRRLAAPDSPWQGHA